MAFWSLPRKPRLDLGTYGPPLLGLKLSLGPQEIATHKHVIGLTGQGKSKLLSSLFVQLAMQDRACALIDPHSDLALDTLGLLADRGFFNRIGAFGRLIYVDFSNRERFLPFNFLSQRYSPHDVARHVVEACKRAWPALSSGAAPQFENILLAGVFALIENQRALTDLPRLLTDKPFRDGLLRQVSDPQVVAFFQDRFDRWGRDAPMMVESTLRRVFLLTFSPTLRFSLGHRENALDFRQLMDDGVCAIFNLGGLDEETQRFLGCLITVGFEVAALSRADTPLAQRRDYHLIIDEFSQFSAQSEEALARVLSLARKYGLYLTLAHQTWSQLSSRLHGALQNAVEIAFRLGRSDAEWAAPRFGHFDPMAVKHEVVDPYQVDRTHPVFYSVQETFESWTRALMDLRPRQAFVKLSSRTAKIQTLDASPSTRAVNQVSAIAQRYATNLLSPRERVLAPDRREDLAIKTERIVRLGREDAVEAQDPD